MCPVVVEGVKCRRCEEGLVEVIVQGGEYRVGGCSCCFRHWSELPKDDMEMGITPEHPWFLHN